MAHVNPNGMRNFIMVAAGCLAFYTLIIIGIRLVTDVGELAKSYPHVIYDAKTKSSTIEIKKERPATWTNLGSMSSIAVAAIMLSEDWAFYQHNGFDWQQIWDSFQTNLEKGHFVRGGSTITQQVVKNVFLSHEKTIWRKVQEAILTVRIERQLKKTRILEVYLNIAEFGEGLYGIGPAARHYFGKSPSELNAKEGAFLAMLLPSPRKYSISFRKKELTRFAAGTMRGVLSKLLATHRISEEEYASALITPLNFEVAAAPKATEEAPADELESDSQSSGDSTFREKISSEGSDLISSKVSETVTN